MAQNSTMLRNIYEQPAYLAGILKNREQYTKQFVVLFVRNKIKRVYFCGNGSPHHVSIIISLFMEHLLEVETSATLPGLFNNHQVFNANGLYQPREMLLICPAQSGRTTGPLFSAGKARELGIPVLCTTIHPNGALAKKCDVVIHKPTGEENCFPETKGHIASIAMLLLCVIETAWQTGKITNNRHNDYLRNFRRIVSNSAQLISDSEKWYAANKHLLLQAESCHIIGYGANYATAREGAMKMAETMLVPSHAHELEEFLHGYNQCIKKNTALIFLAADSGSERERMLEVFQWCRRHSDHCILVCGNDVSEGDENALVSAFTDEPYLSTMEYLLPLQVLSHSAAIDRGLNSGSPPFADAGRELGAFTLGEKSCRR